MPESEPLDIVMTTRTDFDIPPVQYGVHRWPFAPVAGTSFSSRPTIHCHSCGCLQWLQFDVDVVKRKESESDDVESR
jgi:hypothetical protein